MHVELTADAQAALRALVQDGTYASEQQIIEVAVQNLLLAEPNNTRLRKLVQEGIDSARNEPLVTEDQFLQHLAERRLKRA